jgi:hypothetical protein
MLRPNLLVTGAYFVNIMPGHRIYCGQNGSITTQFAPTLELYILTQLSGVNGSCWVQTTPLLLIKASPVG